MVNLVENRIKKTKFIKKLETLTDTKKLENSATQKDGNVKSNEIIQVFAKLQEENQTRRRMKIF
jgi:hypothetical protein